MESVKHLHTLTFAVRSADKADGGPLRFEGVAYSGGVVPAYGWRGDVVIDLSGLKNADGEELPVLVDHQASVEAIAGKGRLFRFTHPDGTQGLRIEGEVIDATDAGRQIAALLKADFPLQMSVGMNASFREVTEPLVVNGRQVRALTYQTQLILITVRYNGWIAGFSVKPRRVGCLDAHMPACHRWRWIDAARHA